MIYFEPKKLKNAEERVVENHRLAASIFESSSVKDTQTGMHLLRKLKRYTNPRELVESLTRGERRAFSGLFQIDDTSVVDFMCRCIFSDPTLMSTKVGWGFVAREPASDLGKLMLEALSHPYHTNHLSNLQRVIVQHRKNPKMMAQQFWKNALMQYENSNKRGVEVTPQNKADVSSTCAITPIVMQHGESVGQTFGDSMKAGLEKIGKAFAKEPLKKGHNTSPASFENVKGNDVTPQRERYLEIASLKKEDALTQYLDYIFLTQADKNDWGRSNVTDVMEQFKTVDHAKKMLGLVNLRTIFPKSSGFNSVKSPLFQIALSVFNENEKTQQYMKRDYPSVHEWFRQALMKDNLGSFFEIYKDNERFQFWLEFLSKIENLRTDEENGRLFLDFGDFGIIEFGAVGNAAYIYETKYFDSLVQRNFKQSLRNDELKNVDLAIHRINHNKHWRTNTRDWLRGQSDEFFKKDFR